jgi:putative FmdB family regulatory protein
MPIYDYLCSACDHRADILHGINDPGPQFCPSCGAEDSMRKQFAVPTVHFKGSGWAKKDRGGSSRTRAAAAAGSGEGKGGKDGDGDASAPADGATKSDAPSTKGSDAAASSGPAPDKGE